MCIPSARALKSSGPFTVLCVYVLRRQGNPDHSSFHLRNLNFSEPLSMRLPLNHVHLEMAMAMAVDEVQLDATIDRGLQVC